MQTFGFIWSKLWSERARYETPANTAERRRWLFERYCDNDPKRLDAWLAGGKKIILDAGCGSSLSAFLFFGDRLKGHDYLGVDISESIQAAEARFQEAGYPGDFLQRSLVDLPIKDESIDMIFSEGVLHHTDSTEKSIAYLSSKLKSGGLFLFYVYRKKAAIREFTDDFIRRQLVDLSDEEAWNALLPLTNLGIALGKLNVKVEVPEDIPLLGISKGSIDIQRFFYWNICKMFYNQDFNLDEMNHVNFDWFRPLNCHRHTEEEVGSFCRNASLHIEHMNVQESGITVVARKL